MDTGWKYAVVAKSTLFADHVEIKTETARDALAHSLALRRRFGRNSSVEVIRRGGQTISIGRLKSLAGREPDTEHPAEIS